MKLNKYPFLAICLFLNLASFFFCQEILAQGCSDAGICTAGGMHGGIGRMEKGSLSLNFQYGVGEQQVKILTPQIEGLIRINGKSSVQLKLPYVFASGNIGRNNGLGDMVAIYTYQYYNKNEKRIGLNIGTRLGVNNANRFKVISMESGTKSLPMPYQTSLGTYDLLAGIDFKYKENYLLAFGAQVPLVNFNHNQFDTSLIDDGAPLASNSLAYFSSYHLKRRPDIVLRADKIFNFNDRFSFTAGLIGIYHLLHDRAIDASGKESAIHGSKGLTLNIPVALNYKFSPQFSCATKFAAPIIVRQVRPDGLTRHFVASLVFSYTFL